MFFHNPRIYEFSLYLLGEQPYFFLKRKGSATVTFNGTHPSEYGYRLWADSILPQLRPILKKYGIKL